MDDRAFIRHVAGRLGADEVRAEAVTFAVLQEVRDRLPPKEAADVAAQLPTALRRIWQEPDRPGREVVNIHEPEFVGRVRRLALLRDDAEAEHAVRVVFTELQRLLGSPTGKEGEAWDVFSVLPKDLKMLGSPRAVEPDVHSRIAPCVPFSGERRTGHASGDSSWPGDGKGLARVHGRIVEEGRQPWR